MTSQGSHVLKTAHVIAEKSMAMLQVLGSYGVLKRLHSGTSAGRTPKKRIQIRSGLVVKMIEFNYSYMNYRSN
jgi:hypothetical protein